MSKKHKREFLSVLNSVEKPVEPVAPIEPDVIEQQEIEEPENPEPQTAVIPALKFDGNGWCEELQRSYFIGVEQVRTIAEYEALKKYAIGD